MQSALNRSSRNSFVYFCRVCDVEDGATTVSAYYRKLRREVGLYLHVMEDRASELQKIAVVRVHAV